MAEFSIVLSALAAGALTVLSPCVLPIVPFVAQSALHNSKLGPLALSLGLILSFSGLTFIFARSGHLLGLDQQTLQTVAAVFLLITSLFFLIPAWSDKLSGSLASLTKLGKQFEGDGLRSEFLNGLFLGPVWVPCSGPTLGVIMGLLATQDTHAKALAPLLAFSFGSLAPLLFLSYGARKYIERFQSSALKHSATLKKVMGLLVLAMSLLILTGGIKKIEIFILQHMPDWWLELTVAI